MQVVKNKNIPLVLQLIKSDLTYEDGATVTYNIYDSSFNEEVSEQSVTWNNALNSYTGTLSPSADWSGQETGNYLLVWNVSDTDLFASRMTEEIVVVENSDIEFEDVNEKLDEIVTNTENISANMQVVDTKSDTIITNTEGISANMQVIDTKSDTIITNTEEISANIDTAQVKLDRLLGLSHENLMISNPVYDRFDNLQSATMRLYSDAVSVGTENNILAEYEITAKTINVGKFNTWQQKRTK